MSKFLVTGGAGFIGSNIVDELLRQGHDVRVIDNFMTGRRENLKDVMEKIELVEGDIRDIDHMRKATKGIEFVLHQAAFRSVPKSVDNPTLTNDINVNGTLNVLIAAKEAGVKRLVYASSSSCYGETNKFPENEEDLPGPISPYAVSKLTGEYYCKTFTATYGLETVSLRYFNVFGPRQNPESKYSCVIPAFIFRMLKGESPLIDGDGEQSRDFTFVKNVVDANIKASSFKTGKRGEVFNVARGEAYSILDLVNILNELMKKNITPKFGPTRAGDVKRTEADVSKLKKKLKVIPKISFKDGLKETLKWFDANKVELS
ncbi:MAG: SDR family oxidoreductase [Candidatus Omnitrophica bacterium]|nr:SDR family oxidoreductase [Candidatus Omnitrophota bacterium]